MLRLLVGYDVSGGRRSREVIRDTRDYRCGPVKQTIDPTAETCQTRGQRLSTLLRGPVSPSWPLWRDWVRGYGGGPPARKLRRTTEVPQRLRIHTDYAVAPPDFKREAYESSDAERGARQRHVHRDAVDATRRERVSPRRCRRII